jgi:hypothetical protein
MALQKVIKPFAGCGQAGAPVTAWCVVLPCLRPAYSTAHRPKRYQEALIWAASGPQFGPQGCTGPGRRRGHRPKAVDPWMGVSLTQGWEPRQPGHAAVAREGARRAGELGGGASRVGGADGIFSLKKTGLKIKVRRTLWGALPASRPPVKALQARSAQQWCCRTYPCAG